MQNATFGVNGKNATRILFIRNFIFALEQFSIVIVVSRPFSYTRRVAKVCILFTFFFPRFNFSFHFPYTATTCFMCAKQFSTSTSTAMTSSSFSMLFRFSYTQSFFFFFFLFDLCMAVLKIDFIRFGVSRGENSDFYMCGGIARTTETHVTKIKILSFIASFHL